MPNKIYFLDTTTKPAVWIPYVSQMVLPKNTFSGKTDYMRYKFVGWDKEKIVCIAPLSLGSTMIDHAKIVKLAIEIGLVKKESSDNIWGKIGASGKIISWKSIRGTTKISKQSAIANLLGLDVNIPNK